MLGNVGAPELLIILAVVLLLFGATRLPKLAKSLGEAKKEFERGSIEERAEEKAGTSSDIERLRAEREAEEKKLEELRLERLREERLRQERDKSESTPD